MTDPITPAAAPAPKVGDIVNSHRLEQAPDGTLSWVLLTPEQLAAAEKKPAKWRKPLLITIASLVGLIVLITIIGSLNRGNKADAIDPDKDSNKGSSQVEEPAEEPEPEPEPEPESVNPAFGDTFAWENGVGMTVSAPAGFTPSKYAAGADQATNVIFTITIINGSDENLDPLVYSKVSSGGVEASQIFDTENNLGFPPTTVILPGGTISWTEAYSITDINSIIFQTSPSTWDYEDAIFTNVK